MNTWEEEFPDFGEMPQSVLDAYASGKITDTSWHNDVCPSFENLSGTVRLWVDYEDRSRRELPDGGRFHVCTNGDDDTIHEGDDAQAAVDALLSYKRSERFVLVVGSIREVYPDIPEEFEGRTVIYDRQERRPVVTLHEAYSNLLCLEVTTPAGHAPMSDFETYLNQLTDRELESEGISGTRKDFGQ